MENLTRQLGNYAIPVLLLILGIVFTYKYLVGIGDPYVPKQPSGVLWGGVFLIIAGAVSLPIVQAAIGRKIALAAGAVFLLASGFLYWSIWNSVEDEIEYQTEMDTRTRGVVQRLKDIRAAQEAFFMVNGTYTNNFDSLIAFVTKPMIPVVYKVGDELNDSVGGGKIEAYLEAGYVIKQKEVDSVAREMGFEKDQFLSMIENNKTHFKIRDTTYVSFYDQNFAPSERKKKDLPRVSLDSLPYNPYTGEKFIMDTSHTEVAGLRQSTILVKDPTPFGRENVNMKRDTLMFGSLTEGHTDGNWRNLE